MSKLAWLHLSDIHFLPTNEWQDSPARTALLEFLQDQTHKKNLQIDLIFCTGDIAFGELRGQALSAQYAMAAKFFDQVLDICQCDKSRLFIVPGNHDIDREQITTATQQSWTRWGSDGQAAGMADQICAGFAKMDKDTKDAMRRLNAWGKFVAKYCPHQRPAAAGHHHNAQILEIYGRKIGIAGFNSAWTCASDHDDRTLWLAAGPQFDHMRKTLTSADLKIGLIHHPWDWFNLAERKEIKQRIGDDAHFWLHGHTHDAWVEPLASHVTLGAGAVAANTEAEFGCNVVQLDFDGGKGRAFPYRYQKDRVRWLSDNAVTPDGDGVWCFDLPPRALAAWRQAGEAADDKQHQQNNQQNKPPSPPPIAANDSVRIEQTRKAILACLCKSNFDGMPDDDFAEDGMPRLLSDAFLDGANNIGNAMHADQAAACQRVRIADDAIHEILQFAKKFVAACAADPADAANFASASPTTARRNTQRWKHFVNAMQHAILLSAKQNFSQSQRIQAAYAAEPPCEIEGMSWLSASVAMRGSLADSLRTRPGGGKDPIVDNHTDDWSEVEFGTMEAAKIQSYKAINYIIDRSPFPDKPSQRQIEELQGETKKRKREGRHVLVFNGDAKNFTSVFHQWLNQDMHVGHVTIMARNGEFDLKEGDWRAYLVGLLKVLSKFEPEFEPT